MDTDIDGRNLLPRKCTSMTAMVPLYTTHGGSSQSLIFTSSGNGLFLPESGNMFSKNQKVSSKEGYVFFSKRLAVC